MKTKNLIILGVILVVLIGIVVLSENLGSKQSSGESSTFFTGFSKDNCSAFQITDKSGTVKIRRKGDIWVVVNPEKNDAQDQKDKNASVIEGMAENESKKDNMSGSPIYDEYPADSASVVTALEKIQNMKRDELISKNPEKQTTFEVDSAKGLLLEVWDNNKKSLGAVRIGKSGATWDSHYVRAVGSNNVYNVFGSVRYSFFTDEKRWRDKTVTKFDKSQVKKITLAKQDAEPIVIEKTIDTAGSPVWNISEPEKVKADSSAVEKMITALSGLTTAEWEESFDKSEKEMGLNPPQLQISVELENGDQKVIYKGNKKEDKSQIWVKVQNKEPIFLLYDSKFNDIDKGLADLKEKSESADTKKKS